MSQLQYDTNTTFQSRNGFSGLLASAKPLASRFGLSPGVTYGSQTGTEQVSCSQHAPPPW